MDEAGSDQSPTLERPAPLDDLVGKRWVTQFRIVRLIGCGGMGEVWAAASDDLPGQMLAVKVISPEHAHRRDVIERFFAEARAASALEDPNVVKIDSTGRLDDGRPVLIMEYVDGPSLQAMVEEQGPLPLDTIGQLMIQAASALRSAHAKNIIHRDIKPSNLLVCRRWGRTAHLVVVDFGIAKLCNPQLAGGLRTRTKQFMGTPGFLAPEQAHGRAIDAKVDTYALGVVLYYVLSGRLPYQGDSDLEVLTLQAKGAPFPAPIELRPDTPPEWNALVRDCVQLDPARRPTAVEFARRIAAGLPNGRTLLKTLAPEVAVHRGKSAVFAATLSIDVPTALSQLSAQHDVPRVAAQQRDRVVRIGLAIAGVLVGCVMTVIALRVAASTDRECSREPSALLGSAAGAAGVALDAGAADAARLAVPAVDAGSLDAASVAAHAKPSAIDAPKVAKPSLGRISVSVRPFADVYIDGALIGSTPVEAAVAAGRHVVRLVNQPRGRDENITVTVEPNKPVILEKSW